MQTKGQTLKSSIGLNRGHNQKGTLKLEKPSQVEKKTTSETSRGKRSSGSECHAQETPKLKITHCTDEFHHWTCDYSVGNSHIQTSLCCFNICHFNFHI